MGDHSTNGEFNTNDTPELWRHPKPESTQMYAFQEHVKQKHNLSIAGYQDLWQWSVDHPAAFWEEIWHYTQIKAEQPYQSVSNRLICTAGESLD